MAFRGDEQSGPLGNKWPHERESQMDHQGSRTKKKELHNTKQPSSCPEASAEGPSRWHEKDEIKQKRYDDDDDGGKSVNSSTSFELPGKKNRGSGGDALVGCAWCVCCITIRRQTKRPTNQPTVKRGSQSVLTALRPIWSNLIVLYTSLHAPNSVEKQTPDGDGPSQCWVGCWMESWVFCFCLVWLHYKRDYSTKLSVERLTGIVWSFFFGVPRSEKLIRCDDTAAIFFSIVDITNAISFKIFF